MAATGRRSTRTLVLAGVLVLVVVLLGIVLWQRNQAPAPEFCTADGALAPNGEVYGREVNQDCQFVDGDGNVVGE